MSTFNTPAALTQIKQLNWISRLAKHRRLELYNRLFVMVVMANALVFAFHYFFAGFNIENATGLTLKYSLVNFTLAILIRQQRVVNFLFWLFTRAPVHWPLGLRWTLGKVYHHGGIHTGSATMGVGWHLVSFMLFWHPEVRSPYPSVVFGIALSGLILVVALTMVFFALPRHRRKNHNLFEKTHRFGGWLLLTLFWVHTLYLVKASIEVGSTPNYFAILLLCLVTYSVVLPWLALRRVAVEVTTPSSHVAVLDFKTERSPMAGSSSAVSLDPLNEWHHFANVPHPDRDGFRLVVSRAGDWTGSFIDSKPSHVWLKGTHTAGVANIEVLFKRVIYLATGSGIGPCLPHLLEKKVPAKLVWATRNPVKTYGEELVAEIKQAQPDAVVWDTDQHGKPDLVELAYAAYLDFEAEAVICISNQKVTQHVLYQFESRGIPAFGAIWDS